MEILYEVPEQFREYRAPWAQSFALDPAQFREALKRASVWAQTIISPIPQPSPKDTPVQGHSLPSKAAE